MTGQRCYKISGGKEKFVGQLGKLLRQEGEDTITSAKFYRAVVQAVLLSVA